MISKLIQLVNSQAVIIICSTVKIHFVKKRVQWKVTCLFLVIEKTFIDIPGLVYFSTVHKDDKGHAIEHLKFLTENK